MNADAWERLTSLAADYAAVLVRRHPEDAQEQIGQEIQRMQTQRLISDALGPGRVAVDDIRSER